MQPKKSVLKFRHPFYDDVIDYSEFSEGPFANVFEMAKKYGVDFEANCKVKSLTYLKGDIYVQAFAGPSSAETRLLIEEKLENFDYGQLGPFENKMFYFNNIERCYKMHENKNADRTIGFDHCNDCALENLIWEDYVSKHGGTVRAYVKKLISLLGKPLIRDKHGKMFREHASKSHTKPVLKSYIMN
jgi:hypothetical protein